VRSAVAAALLLAASPAAAADGAALFKAHCASCHATASPGAPMAGPNLAGLAGRPVAGDAAFGYSPVLTRAGRAGQVWDAGRLDAFLADPEAMYPGLWMGGNGVADAAARAALVRYLTGS
jgi:cytochrome c